MRMLTPEDFVENGGFDRKDLVFDMHYLSDSGLVELMRGYIPPLFAAARISAKGIDLVENRFQFDLRFPPEVAPGDQDLAELPHLLERLVAEVDISALDGDSRKRALRDVQYLREEIAAPVASWRREVIQATLDWIAAPFDTAETDLPSFDKIRQLTLGSDGKLPAGAEKP